MLALVIDYRKCKEMLDGSNAVCVYTVDTGDGLGLRYETIGTDWEEQLRAIVFGVARRLDDIDVGQWELGLNNYPEDLQHVHKVAIEAASVTGVTVLCAQATTEQSLGALEQATTIAGYLGDAVVVVSN